MTKRRWAALLAAGSCACFFPISLHAQNPVERRLDRNARQIERQALRLGNRSTYYPDNSWRQVSPWINQHNIAPYRPLANAAANAANATANAVANAVNNAASAANAVATTRFGYQNPGVATTPAGWFYDYYVLPPTSYVVRDGTTDSYGAAHRYHDFNNDGLYDGYYSYRDVNKDGKYDQYDRYDFGQSKDEDNDNDPPYDAHRHTIRGSVEAIKSARVNGVNNTIVRVKTDQSQSLIVDLGPQTELQEGTVTVGAVITAAGPMMLVGEKEVLIAETARIANREIAISRPSPKLEGTVVDVSHIDFHTGKHALAIVKTEQGNQLIDLGDSASINTKFEPNSRIVVYGAPVQMHNHRVVLADQIEINGKKINIQRW